MRPVRRASGVALPASSGPSAPPRIDERLGIQAAPTERETAEDPQIACGDESSTARMVVVLAMSRSALPGRQPNLRDLAERLEPWTPLSMVPSWLCATPGCAAEHCTVRSASLRGSRATQRHRVVEVRATPSMMAWVRARRCLATTRPTLTDIAVVELQAARVAVVERVESPLAATRVVERPRDLTTEHCRVLDQDERSQDRPEGADLEQRIVVADGKLTQLDAALLAASPRLQYLSPAPGQRDPVVGDALVRRDRRLEGQRTTQPARVKVEVDNGDAPACRTFDEAGRILDDDRMDNAGARDSPESPGPGSDRQQDAGDCLFVIAGGVADSPVNQLEAGGSSYDAGPGPSGDHLTRTRRR
jgi:hypothetical protein